MIWRSNRSYVPGVRDEWLCAASCTETTMDLGACCLEQMEVRHEAFAPLDRCPTNAPRCRHADRGHRLNRTVDCRGHPWHRIGRHRPGQAGRGGTAVTGTTKVASRSRRTSWEDEDLPFLPRCRTPARASRNRNYLDMYWWKHSIYGLLEVDVTRARQ